MTATPNILLVDDDPAIRESLRFSLELQGFTVETHANAESMVDREVPDKGCCLVLDYYLPGMDGLSLLTLLRQRGTLAPALLITSNPARALKLRAAEAGAEIIEKPLLCDALVAAIRSELAGRGDAESAGRHAGVEIENE
jgi:FixJ family two-component response regulator